MDPGMSQAARVHHMGMVADLQRLQMTTAPPGSGLFVHATREEALRLHTDDGILACSTLERGVAILGPDGLGRSRKLEWSLLDTGQNPGEMEPIQHRDKDTSATKTAHVASAGEPPIIDDDTSKESAAKPIDQETCQCMQDDGATDRTTRTG